MSIPPVLLLGDPRLRKVSQKVTLNLLQNPQFKQDSLTLRKGLQRFRDTYGFGRAIASPQINIHHRMIAMNLYGSYTNLSGMPLGNESFLIINPEVIDKTNNDTFTLWDDCMSFPDLLVKVSRYRNIAIKWMDIDSNIHEWDFNDIKIDLSELLQHEMDHLDGVLSPDRALDKDSIVFRSVYDENKQYFNKQVDYNIYNYLE
eukprot:217024_1